jgi:signal transduction histidine kinase
MQPYFADDRQPKPLAEEVRVIVFQAVRELLHNVTKHAGAKHVSVSLSREDDYLQVQVKDDGRGFDSRKAGLGVSKAEGFGLFNLREQLDYIGGRVEVESSKEGTVVTIVAPLAQLVLPPGRETPNRLSVPG